jgi:hypothetical protein
MALRSQTVLSKYKSISRPSLTGSFSSYTSSLVKKNNAAEDAIIDNQYEAGLLSPENYLVELQKRAARDYTTPLQKVNYDQKMQDVQTKIIDAQVDKAYSSGQMTTDQVIQYERDKLSKMTEPDSLAYIQQAKKVQGLVDKSEREKRNAFRISENLRISKLPEDNSERLLAKAGEYQKLAAQARIDGDNQQGDVFETNYNNYVQATKRAQINDLITGARSSVSQTPTKGLGVPTAEAGQQFYNQITGQTENFGVSAPAAPSVSGVTVSPGSSGAAGVAATGFQSHAIKNALESLDRSQKHIDSLYQQRADKQELISAYQNAVNQATGDQKTTLQISLNNLIEDVKGIDNQIGITTQGIQDTVVHIQDIQQKQAASAFSQDVRKNNMAFDKVENELENALSKGKITKEEYIEKGVALAAAKTEFFNQASNGFSQFGNDLSAESYLQKASQMEDIHQSLIGVGQNINDYALIAVDPGGKVNNLLGKTLRPGDFALTNIRQMKDSKVFDSNYVRIGNVYYRVHYPGEVSDVSGLPLSAITDQQLAEIRGTAFIYKNPTNPKDAANRVSFITFTNEEGKPEVRASTTNDADTLLKRGILINDQKKGLIEKPQIEPGFLMKVGAEVQKAAENILPGFKELEQTVRGEMPLPNLGTILSAKPQLGFLEKPIRAISNTVQNVGNLLQKNVVDKVLQSKPGQQTLDFLNKAKDNVLGTLGNTVSNLSKYFVPEVKASEIDTKTTPAIEGKVLTSSGVGTVIDKVANEIAPGNADFRKALHAIALAESGGNPNAIGDNGNSIGLFQNNMYAGRGFGHTKEQLLDPEYNTRLAAKDLINHYNKAKNLGYKGSDIAVYMSRYGQRPAAGNEFKPAKFYGKYVSGTPVPETKLQQVQRTIISNIKPIVEKAYARETPQQAQVRMEKQLEQIRKPVITPQPGQLVAPVSPDQIVHQIDYGQYPKTQYEVPRTLTQQLVKNPSVVVNKTLQDLGVRTAEALQPVANIGNKAVSVVGNIQQNVQKAVQSLPKISVPQISLPKIEISKPIQQMASNVGKTVSNTVSSAVSSAKNLLSKLKFW